MLCLKNSLFAECSRNLAKCSRDINFEMLSRMSFQKTPLRFIWNYLEKFLEHYYDIPKEISRMSPWLLCNRFSTEAMGYCLRQGLQAIFFRVFSLRCKIGGLKYIIISCRQWESTAISSRILKSLLWHYCEFPARISQFYSCNVFNYPPSLPQFPRQWQAETAWMLDACKLTYFFYIP